MTRRAAWVVSGLIASGAALLAQPTAPAAPLPVAIAVNRPGADIASTMYGIFFEDINFAADGGIYAEKIKNRSFEFPDPLMGWKRAFVDGARGSFAVATDAPPSPGNPALPARDERSGPLRRHQRRVSRHRRAAGRALRRQPARAAPRRRARPRSSSSSKTRGIAGQGSATIAGLTTTWARYRATVVAEKPNGRARLRVLTSGPGTVDLDMVSLFPEDTWQGRENGLRKDLVQLLKDMKPGFLRFPGGCIVEGRFLDGRYQWKTTIGEPSERRLIINRWNDEFANRATPDYYQSFGLGFFEYFLLSEDLGAEPLPIVNCGMACQFNSGELAPLDAIDPVHPGRARPDRVRQRPGDERVGRQARRARPSGAVQPEAARRRQRAVGTAVHRAVRAVREDARRRSIRRSRSSRAPTRTSAATTSRGSGTACASCRPTSSTSTSISRPTGSSRTSGATTRIRAPGPKVFVGEYAAHVPAGRAAEHASEHARGRAGRSRVHDRLRAQRRRGADVGVRAAAGARRRLAVDAEPDLVRQPALVRHAELPRRSRCSAPTAAPGCCRWPSAARRPTARAASSRAPRSARAAGT